MEFTTTDSQNDTIVLSKDQFVELYHETPEESRGQLYFDGFLVKIVEIDNFLDEVHLQSCNGFDFVAEYY